MAQYQGCQAYLQATITAFAACEWPSICVGRGVPSIFAGSSCRAQLYTARVPCQQCDESIGDDDGDDDGDDGDGDDDDDDDDDDKALPIPGVMRAMGARSPREEKTNEPQILLLWRLLRVFSYCVGSRGSAGHAKEKAWQGCFDVLRQPRHTIKSKYVFIGIKTTIEEGPDCL